MRLGVLQVVFDDLVHNRPCDVKATVGSPQDVFVEKGSAPARPLFLDDSDDDGVTTPGGGAAEEDAGLSLSLSAVDGPCRKDAQSVDVSTFDFEHCGFTLNAALMTHPVFAVDDELSESDDEGSSTPAAVVAPSADVTSGGEGDTSPETGDHPAPDTVEVTSPAAVDVDAVGGTESGAIVV